jgi:hypothetical protein
MSAGETDVVLAKLTPAGSLSWRRVIGGSGVERVRDLDIDAVGSPILVGSFSGAVDFGGGSVAGNANESFVVKYSTANSYQWARTFEVGDGLGPTAAGVTAAGDIYLAGSFVGSLDLGVDVLAAEGAGSNLFLARLTSSGVALWNRSFAGEEDDSVWAVALLPTGEPVLAGGVSGTIDFGAGTLSSAGNTDAFVARFAR